MPLLGPMIPGRDRSGSCSDSLLPGQNRIECSLVGYWPSGLLRHGRTLSIGKCRIWSGPLYVASQTSNVSFVYQKVYKVNNSTAITGLIIIPSNYLDHFADDRGHLGIKRTRMATIVYVNGHNGIFGKIKDVFQLFL